MNDTRSKAIVSQVVEMTRMVADAMERLEVLDNSASLEFLEKLQPFTE